MTGSCCCTMGAAVKGEHPELDCARCPVHAGGWSATVTFRKVDLCRRHWRTQEAVIPPKKDDDGWVTITSPTRGELVDDLLRLREELA